MPPESCGFPRPPGPPGPAHLRSARGSMSEGCQRVCGSARAKCAAWSPEPAPTSSTRSAPGAAPGPAHSRSTARIGPLFRSAAAGTCMAGPGGNGGSGTAPRRGWSSARRGGENAERPPRFFKVF